MTKNKQKDTFKVLSDAEHILLRPQMYIGSTSAEKVKCFVDGNYSELSIVPGLFKIFNEVLDNSIDEFIRTNGDYANKIEVNINHNSLVGSSVSVRDNGRGIPVEKLETGVYRPYAAWHLPRAGTNFGDERDTIGAHGLGSYLTNVFSTEFNGETCDGNKHFFLKTVGNSGKVIENNVHVPNNTESFTCVTFSPDFSIFGVDDFDQDHLTLIKERLNNLAVCFPGITFKFNGETIKFRTVKAYSEQFSDNPVVYSDDDNLLIFANAGSDEEFRYQSYVNGLHMSEGGSHIDYVMSSVIDELRPKINKKHKIDIKPNAIMQNLVFVSILRNMKNLKFHSQTKERLTNPKDEIREQFSKVNFSKIAQKIMETPEIIDPIVEATIQKKLLAERLAAARKQKKMKKVRVVSHIEAMSKDPEKKILFISEGDSAMNPLCQFRDPETIGGYPLRGKVKNTRGLSPKEIVDNKEIRELLSIVGLEIDKPADNLNYGTIAIMTDADTDGASIACMLINLFYNWPKLFEEQRVYIAITPLFVAKKKSKVQYFYNFDEYHSANLDKGWTVKYTKGLGTLSEEAYSDMINNPRLLRIDLGDNPETVLEMAFGSESQLRKDWLLGEKSI
tara:strand:- start:1883 stop:3733 length:1851 start_codon:yes stop_codon:yes gene_type:complete